MIQEKGKRNQARGEPQSNILSCSSLQEECVRSKMYTKSPWISYDSSHLCLVCQTRGYTCVIVLTCNTLRFIQLAISIAWLHVTEHPCPLNQVQSNNKTGRVKSRTNHNIVLTVASWTNYTMHPSPLKTNALCMTTVRGKFILTCNYK